MASIHAIQAACESVMRLFQESYAPDLIEPQLNLQFEVYRTEDFKTHMAAGVSLFLYRVYVNGSQRASVVRDRNGLPQPAPLPLDLHFFLTVWAPQASLQHAILGWAMRTLEDYSTLPAALLNGARPGVFRDEETIEIIAGQLTNEELMRIWDDLATEYTLSIPYIARVARIDSLTPAGDGSLVRRRDLDMATLEGG